MPPQNGVRLNDPGQTKQARPASCHPYQQGAVTTPQPETVRCAPQDDVELMPKEEVLNFKPTARLEQIGDIHSEQMDDRKSSFRMMRGFSLTRESDWMEFSGTTGRPSIAPERSIGAMSDKV